MADFIFMLTRHDQTIEDCLETLAAVKHLGVGHIGFKDIGVDRQTMHRLVHEIRAAGAVSYLEVVSTTPEDCVHSARTAVEIGVDRLLGGGNAAEILAVVSGTEIAYHPFPGRPAGHPTRLCGSPEDVATDCRRFETMGCAGADVLAYRAVEAEPLELVRAAREALSGYLIVAGSVDSPARIREVSAAGADAFTIGSAVFDGSFSLRKGSTISQLKDVLAACAA